MFISTWTLRVVQVVHWLRYKIFIQRVLGLILIIIIIMTTKPSPFLYTSHQPSTCLCFLSLHILFVYLVSPPYFLSFELVTYNTWIYTDLQWEVTKMCLAALPHLFVFSNIRICKTHLIKFSTKEFHWNLPAQSNFG